VEILCNYFDQSFPNATYYSVYEAGFSGFCARYALLEVRINNIVVNAADVPTYQKKKMRKINNVDT